MLGRPLRLRPAILAVHALPPSMVPRMAVLTVRALPPSTDAHPAAVEATASVNIHAAMVYEIELIP